MKLSLLITLIIMSIFFSNCKKSNSSINARPALAAIQGTWRVKSQRCYQDPNINVSNPPSTYFTFNTDMSFTVSTPSTLYIPTTYELLNDDTTLILQISSLGPVRDSFVITKITPTEFIYHGINTYPKPYSPAACLNGNFLDSLYR